MRRGCVSLVLAAALILHGAANNTIADDVIRRASLAIESRKPRDAGEFAASQLPTAIPTLTDDLIDRFIVIPEYKLLFCYVEKVACTAFNRLFLYLRGLTQKANGLTKGIWFANSPSEHNMDKSDVAKLLVDPTWYVQCMRAAAVRRSNPAHTHARTHSLTHIIVTILPHVLGFRHKAVFYREPLERFLSGYQSKCERGHDRDGFAHCIHQFGDNVRNKKRIKKSKKKTPIIGFAGAVNYVAQQDRAEMDKDQTNDEHWTRQARFCGGLENTLQYYDTVEELQKETARDKVSTMLTKIGVPLPINSTIPAFDALFPPMERGEQMHNARNPKHTTNAAAAEKKYYNTTALSNTVMAHYMEDYLLFGIKAPTWAIASLENRQQGH